MKSHQMWLRHELGRRWDEIPPDLRQEAEDCRDLQLTKSKKTESMRPVSKGGNREIDSMAQLPEKSSA